MTINYKKPPSISHFYSLVLVLFSLCSGGPRGMVVVPTAGWRGGGEGETEGQDDVVVDCSRAGAGGVTGGGWSPVLAAQAGFNVAARASLVPGRSGRPRQARPPAGAGELEIHSADVGEPRQSPQASSTPASLAAGVGRRGRPLRLYRGGVGRRRRPLLYRASW